MSESQSRYSIVADLTQTKLEIITAKSNLDSETKLAKQKIEQLKEELNDLEASQKEEFAASKRKTEREIKNAEREAKNAEEKKQTKIKSQTFQSCPFRIWILCLGIWCLGPLP